MRPHPPQPTRRLLALLLLGVLAGCASTSSVGRVEEGKPAVRAEPLYPGAEAEAGTEHVYFYPLPEALAAAKAVLEERDFDVRHFVDETQLMTRWRMAGRPTPGRNSHYIMHRYYVQGRVLSPKHSLVRIFRIQTVNMSPSNAMAEEAMAAERAINRSAKGSSTAPNGWREFVAAGARLESESERTESSESETRSVRGSGGIDLLAPGSLADEFARDPRFAGQYDMPTQAELRGSNDRGVRDLRMERTLLERLEQFPSLEFTGGAYDVAPPRAPEGAAPLTAAWETEAGGMPFVKGSDCGQSVQGLEALAAPGATVLVGEPLGTREVPSAVGNTACQLASEGRSVVLGLAMPREEQPRLQAYLESQGTRADQDTLLAGEFWRQAPRDGRSSRALLVLIERVRRWKAAGMKLALVAYDAKDAKGNAREEAVAQLLIERRRAASDAVLLVLGGNYHVSTEGGSAPWSPSFNPFGYRLMKEGVAVKSLDTAFARGTRWTCGVNRRDEAECRVYASAPTEQSYSPPGKALSIELFARASDEGFHGVLHVGALSASLPALAPAPALAARSSSESPKR